MSVYDEIRAILLTEVDESAAKRLCERFRQALGGRRVYFSSTPAPEIRNTDTVVEVRQRHRVSRSTAYRWVNRWRL